MFVVQGVFLGVRTWHIGFWHGIHLILVLYFRKLCLSVQHCIGCANEQAMVCCLTVTSPAGWFRVPGVRLLSRAACGPRILVRLARFLFPCCFQLSHFFVCICLNLLLPLCGLYKTLGSGSVFLCSRLPDFCTVSQISAEVGPSRQAFLFGLHLLRLKGNIWHYITAILRIFFDMIQFRNYKQLILHFVIHLK